MICEGMTNPQIAKAINLSTKKQTLFVGKNWMKKTGIDALLHHRHLSTHDEVVEGAEDTLYDKLARTFEDQYDLLDSISVETVVPLSEESYFQIAYDYGDTRLSKKLSHKGQNVIIDMSLFHVDNEKLEPRDIKLTIDYVDGTNGQTIFVKEVDRSFRVKSDLVIQEVQNGRIVVILDGFDELLHDTGTKRESLANTSFENVEPMLETIGDLLVGNAKVIITSRRSAIFDSSSFVEWMQRRHENFEIIRYKINAPRLGDWLNESRLNLIRQTSLKLENLSNPVLLGYLRFVDDKTFYELMKKPFEIIDIYVKSMLERERNRQDLWMNNDDQNLFLTEIARDMSEKNYTSLPKDELVSNIKAYCGNLLEKTRANYPPGKKPTIDKLATTLSNHCFFDRGTGNTIQFVNEFIFGYYLSNCLMQSSDWVPADERFVEPAILSFQSREQEKKNVFWSKVETIKGVLEKADRMRFEQILKGCVNDDDYDESDITNVFLDSISLFETNSIKNSVFSNCKFNNCIFYFNHFCDVIFLNCVFWNCFFSRCDGEERFDVEFYNCNAPNSDFIEKIESLKKESQLEENPDVKKYILNEICPLGSSLSNIHFYWPKLVSSEKFPKKQILNGLKELRNEGFLEDAHDHDFMKINTSKYGDIKRLLGRI